MDENVLKLILNVDILACPECSSLATVLNFDLEEEEASLQLECPHCGDWLFSQEDVLEAFIEESGVLRISSWAFKPYKLVPMFV